MKNSGRNRKVRRIIITVLLSVFGALLIISVSAYLYVHSFINKMKLVDLSAGEDVYAYDGKGVIEDDAYYEAASKSLDGSGSGFEEVMTVAVADGYNAQYSDGEKPLYSIGEKPLYGIGEKPLYSIGEKPLYGSGEKPQYGIGDKSQYGTGDNLKYWDECALYEGETVAMSDGNGDGNDTSEADIALLEEKISRNMSDSSSQIMKDKDVLNILLIGSDSRNQSKRGLSDSMILLSINKDKEKIVITSLLRDIYLEIAGKSNNRLNTAYSSGGAGLLMDTIERNFKVKVDRYVGIDFYAFIDVIDSIGGITLNITGEEIPVINKYVAELNSLLSEDKEKDYILEAGTQLVNGKQALGYSRVRYVGTDFGRTQRQRRVLELIIAKVRKLKMSELNDLLSVFLPKVTTNFKEMEILTQLFKLPDYLKYDYEQWCIPMEGSYKDMRIRGMAVLGIDFEKNINELYNKVYLTE